MTAERRRLDEELVARGLVATRSRARDLILRGLVAVDGRISDKPGQRVIAGPVQRRMDVTLLAAVSRHALDQASRRPRDFAHALLTLEMLHQRPGGIVAEAVLTSQQLGQRQSSVGVDPTARPE